MFCLLLEPGKRYTKVVDNPFHISAAVLDTTTQDHGIVRVIVDIGDAEVHIANLSMKHGILQVPLDLQFESGSRISFYTSGAKCNVHLSGYVMFDEEQLPSDDEEEEDSSEEEVPMLVPAPVKRKPEDSPEAHKKAKIQKVAAGTPNSTSNATTNAAAAAAKAGSSKPTKISAVPKIGVEDEDSDDDDDEDDDEEDGLESDDGEEEDDEGEEEEEDEDDDESDDEEEEDEYEATEVAKQKQVQKAKGVKLGQFPTKEPFNLFKTEKTPKGATTPGNVGGKTPKMEKQTPKGAMTPGGEATKTPKGAKTPGGESGKTPKGATSGDGAPGKGKKTHGKQQGTTNAATPTLNGKTPKAVTPVKDTAKSPQTPKTVKQGGVVCEDLVVGKGPEAKSGKLVSVYYEGRLSSNKKMFDKCDSGKGFKFRLGSGEVIKGWDVGVSGMRIGGKRRIACPPHMAYGKKGAPPDIPANAALSFVVELKGIS